MGFSLTGAILGNVGASLIELAIARYFIRPSWSKRTIAPLSLLDYAVPIFLATMILRSLGLGLFVLKMLGASAAQAGFYGAAQNVSFIMPGTLALSLSPLLLSTVNRVLRDGNLTAAKVLIRNAIRTVIALLPFAAIASAASNEIAVLLFGRQFASAGPLIAILIFAGLSLLLANLTNAVLISCGKPSWTLWLAAPLLPIAIAGHLFAIPKFGAVGAAAVTAAVTSLGALAGAITVKKFFKVELPVATFLRALLLSGIAYPVVHFWPMHGAATVAEIAIAVIMVLVGFVILGEFRHGEIRFFRDIIRQALNRGLPERSSPEDSQA
jgi:O-antigen/teichoic acid export membrane protein